MKQEDKDLLKDLCARLPYGVKISVNNRIEILEGIDILDNIAEYSSYLSSDIEEIKPYLFPLSSMTIEQKEEERSLKEESYYSFDANENIYTLQDFYNKNHLDYRGLIPMGLAIDCTNLNIY